MRKKVGFIKRKPDLTSVLETSQKEVVDFLDCNGCSLQKYAGMTVVENRLLTQGNDPQIYLQCDDISVNKAELSIEVSCHMTQLRLDVYYCFTENASFTEEQVIHVEYRPGECVHQSIFFARPIAMLRIDPDDCAESVEINRFSISCTHSEAEPLFCFPDMKNVFHEQKKKLLLMTHAMDDTGAPILAFHIAKSFQERGYQLFVLAGRYQDGFLANEYRNLGIPVLDMKPEVVPSGDILVGYSKKEKENLYQTALLHKLVNNGFAAVIANTVVSGEFVPLFHHVGLRVISLIHEMRMTIQLNGFVSFAENIAVYSDVTVFPDKIVKDDFLQVVKKINGESQIRPQGIYFKKYNTVKYGGNIRQEYEIPEKGKVVLGVGIVELRKGFDLFVSAGLHLLTQKPDTHFVWVGDFAANKQLKGWMDIEIEKAGASNSFHFIPFIHDKNKYRAVLETADVFWCSSREDPFPSVVLEAMMEGIPVCAFRNAGGMNSMLAENRGILVDVFDTGNMAQQTLELLNCQNEAKKRKMLENALQYTEYSLDFDKYIDFLETYLIRLIKSGNSR